MTRYQSFQDPCSPAMEGIISLHTYIMFYLVCIVMFVFTAIGLTVYEFYFQTPNQDRIEQMQAAKVVHCTWLELVWTVAPLGILISIAIPSFALLYSMEEKFDVSLTVKAIGHQWYWEYQYALTDYKQGDLYFGFDSYMLSDADLEVGSLRLLETDTTALMPVYHRIRLLTTSTDVIHSWALPAAGVKMDAIPGRLNQVNLYFNRPGHFYGQCSELCGVNHGFMPISVKAIDVWKFRDWTQRFNA
ncbi:cytochrome c oxidase subunit II [bacterium]|nr:MAG: cytochrome c oxidase subunit II [bacterium]